MKTDITFPDPTYGGKQVTDLNDPYVSDTQWPGHQTSRSWKASQRAQPRSKTGVWIWFLVHPRYRTQPSAGRLIQPSNWAYFQLWNKKQYVRKCKYSDVYCRRQIGCEYIYLDRDEQQRFSSASHEYLIEQTQYQGSETTDEPINDALFKTWVQKLYIKFYSARKIFIMVHNFARDSRGQFGLGPTYFAQQQIPQSITMVTMAIPWVCYQIISMLYPKTRLSYSTRVSSQKD